MSWQAWCVLAVVLTFMAIAVGISAVDAPGTRRAQTAAALMVLASAAYVVSAAIAWPA